MRHHLKQLEQAGLVELVDSRPVRGFVEKVYRAAARAVTFNVLLTPYREGEPVWIAMAGYDLALETLGQRLAQKGPSYLLILAVDSLEALVGLRQGSAQLAGCHLYDPASGQYNLTFVRHFFPDRRMALVTLASREMGLMVAPDAPYHPRRLEELLRQGVVFINQRPGSATRLWLDRQLQRLSIHTAAIQGYADEAATQAEAAQAIAHGIATAGLGQHALARQHGLDFVPLFIDRYDLVLPETALGDELYAPLFTELNSDGYLDAVDTLGGYDTSPTGSVTRVG